MKELDEAEVFSRTRMGGASYPYDLREHCSARPPMPHRLCRRSSIRVLAAQINEQQVNDPRNARERRLLKNAPWSGPLPPGNGQTAWARGSLAEMATRLLKNPPGAPLGQ